MKKKPQKSGKDIEKQKTLWYTLFMNKKYKKDKIAKHAYLARRREIQMMKEKGITLIALVITIIVLLILSGVSIAMLTGSNGILTQAQKAKEATEAAAKVENSALSSLEDYMITDGSYNKEKGVNEPRILSGMTEVMFNLPEGSNKGTVIKSGETGFDENNWYDYTSSKWANAVTEDGSYWVWIPRFAYKINSSAKTIDVKFLIGTTDEYYTDETKTKKETAKRAKSATEEVDTTTDYYYVHPAFTNESSIGYANGGWDKEITGIWVAKFEAGYASGNNSAPVKASSANYSQTSSWTAAIEAGTKDDSSQTARNWLDGIYGSTATSIKYPTFQPITYSMNYININDAYNVSRTLTESGNIYGLSNSTTDSHLMKNSEWGAVAYLAQSKYGNNNNEPYINNITLNSGSAKRTETAGKIGVNSVYAVTGVTTGTTNAGPSVKTLDNLTTTGNTANNGTYTWDQIEGQKSSSTLNMYGVFDLSGGVWERTAGYVANGNGNLNYYGSSLTDSGKRTESTKYVTVYPHDTAETSTDIDTKSRANYNVNKYIFGDAIRETSTSGTGATSWKGDYSYFPALYNPFSSRGGSLWAGSYAGLFSFYRANGISYYYIGFRPVLVAL